MLRAIMCLAVVTIPVSFAAAHHSFTKYDGTKQVTLTGTVESVRFQNPHVFFSLVTANGAWTVEAEGLPVLRRAGIDDTVLKSGAKAIVTGWKAKSGLAELGLKSISVGGKSATLRRSTR